MMVRYIFLATTLFSTQLMLASEVRSEDIYEEACLENEALCDELMAQNNLDRNKSLVRNFFEVVFVGGNVSELDNYIGNTYIQHNPRVPDGKEVIRHFIEKRGPLPDDSLIIKRIVAEGDLVFVHSHAQFFAKPRGAAVVDIFRVENGKLIEHWDVIQEVPAEIAHENGMF